MHNTTLSEPIINVYSHNLLEQITIISDLVVQYPIISIDTEFPGVIAYPSTTSRDYNYSLLKMNVDRLKVIQLGLSLSDENGRHPDGFLGWQFNFLFDIEHDCYSADSIHLLLEAGIDFEEHKKNGIDPEEFGSVLTSSGLILDSAYKWVCFHGFFDFGYMYRLVSGDTLPSDEHSFLEKLFIYFPNIYDVKYIAQELGMPHGGLNKYAEEFSVSRIGTLHQAGSDSYVTGGVFHCMMLLMKCGNFFKYMNVVYGLGVSSSTCERYLPNKENYESKISYHGKFKTKYDISRCIEEEMKTLTNRKYYDRDLSSNLIGVEA